MTFSPPESPLLAGPIPPSRTTTITYTYDSLYRLTAADYDTGSYFHYTYDATGNRLTQETELLTNNYVYDVANRLTSVDGQAYTYDSNGNLLSDGVTTYTYDKANRLSAVSQGGVSYAYAYNGLGDRLQQTVDTVTTNYTLDLNTGLTQVLTDGTSTYLYGLGRIGEYNTAWNYYLTDALGSVRQLTDSTGAIALAQSYAPYGDVTETAGETTSNYGYAGEWTDGTGLQHLRARYLNTGIGRFISRDTWAGDYNRPLSLNRWNYGISNPLKYTDPSGNSYVDCGYGIKCEKYTGVTVEEGKADPDIESVTGGVIKYDECDEPIVNTPSSNKVIKKTTAIGGITVIFSAEEGQAWSDNDMEAITKIIQTVAVRLAHTANESKESLPKYELSYVWNKIFGGPVKFVRKDGTCHQELSTKYPQYSGCKGGAYTNSKNEIWAFRDTPPGLFAQFPRIAVHELGHAFENAMVWHGWRKPRHFLTDSMVNRYGLRYENSQDPKRGEIWADMFTGWVFNAWDWSTQKDIEQAKAKSTHMNSNMLLYIKWMME